jgi:hypothetical protein
MTDAPSTEFALVALPSITISTNASNYDPAVLLPIYEAQMTAELKAANVSFDGLELTITLLGQDNPAINSRNLASLQGFTSQIVVITGFIRVRFQNVVLTAFFIAIYVETAASRTFNIFIFVLLNAADGGNTKWEGSDPSDPKVPVTLAPAPTAPVSTPVSKPVAAPVVSPVTSAPAGGPIAAPVSSAPAATKAPAGTTAPAVTKSPVTVAPATAPTKDPTATPTKRPTTSAPSRTDQPSDIPSRMPSRDPSSNPSSNPSS